LKARVRLERERPRAWSLLLQEERVAERDVESDLVHDEEMRRLEAVEDGRRDERMADPADVAVLTD